MGKIVLDRIAYEPHPVSLERKRELNGRGFKIIDARFAPPRHPLDHDGDGRKGGSLPKDMRPQRSETPREDGPTVAEYVAAGYQASGYPPTGYTSRSTPEEIAAAIAEQEKDGSKIELGTDSGDQLSDEQLRAIIEQETGEKPHHRTGRKKLVERFNELNAAAAGE